MEAKDLIRINWHPAPKPKKVEAVIDYTHARVQANPKPDSKADKANKASRNNPPAA